MDKYFESLKILGFDKNATLSNIKKSYLELVQIMHPDRLHKENLKKRANKELQKINDAYNYVAKNYDNYKNIDKLENNQNYILDDDFNYDFEDTEDTEDTTDYFDEYDTYKNEYYTSRYKNQYTCKKREISQKTKILIYIILFILFNLVVFLLIPHPAKAESVNISALQFTTVNYSGIL